MSFMFGRHVLYSVLKVRRLCNISAEVTLQIQHFVSQCSVEQMQTRGLIRVSGSEVSLFLQGLITNDIRHLDEGANCIFTMILNTKGRVLYDALIYKIRPDCLYIDCDSRGREDLQKHLKMFRVRRKVDIQVDDDIRVWSLFTPFSNSSVIRSIDFEKDFFWEKMLKLIVLKTNESQFCDKLMCFKDPRLKALGIRILAPPDFDVITAINRCDVNAVSSSVYKMSRYRLGIGEGIEELPIGKCFPLEANCDYLHGVSFHKGCYVGQEVTARTYHTGVVRKRLMPLKLDSEESSGIKNDSLIEDMKGNRNTPVGKVRGIERDTGIGLMRVNEALQLEKLKIGNVTCKTMKPFWWPQELPKDRMDTKM